MKMASPIFSPCRAPCAQPSPIDITRLLPIQKSGGRKQNSLNVNYATFLWLRPAMRPSSENLKQETGACQREVRHPSRGMHRALLSLGVTTMFQVIGYTLLDFDDAYQLTEVGTFSARYAYLATWEMGTLFDEMAGHHVSLPSVRREFRQMLLTHQLSVSESILQIVQSGPTPGDQLRAGPEGGRHVKRELQEQRDIARDADDWTTPGFLEAVISGNLGFMASRKAHPAELRERGVAMVFELRAEPGNARGSIARVGHRLGISTEPLRNWCRRRRSIPGSGPVLRATIRKGSPSWSGKSGNCGGRMRS